MQVTAGNITEFSGGATGNMNKLTKSAGGPLMLLVDGIQPSVHVDIEILDTNDAVLASKTEKGSALQAGLIIQVNSDPSVLSYALVDGAGANLIVDIPPASANPAKLMVRLAGKIDGILMRGGIESFNLNSWLGGAISGNGVYEITIPFTGTQS